MRAPILTFLLNMIPALAMAEGTGGGPLSITGAIARPTTATAMTGAGYMTVSNSGPTAETLLRIDADFPRVMLHETVIEAGLAKMRHLETITIPAGESIALAPGGIHVMFMGLGGDPFELGEEIPATLIFESAGAIEITFTVTEIVDQ